MELGYQVREREVKTKAETKERREKVMTSGGPVMEAEDVEFLLKKHKQQQLLNKLNLTKQNDGEKMAATTIREIEISQERQDAERIAAKHIESKLVKQQ